MKTFQIPVLLLLITAFNCASTSSVAFDYDTNEDFEKHTTFVICEDDLNIENEQYPNYDNLKIRQFLSEHITCELEDQGLQVDSYRPDLQVGFRLVIKEKTIDFKDCSDFRELQYWEECKIQTETYTTETIIVYVSNLKKNQIVWQASIPCDMNKTGKKLESYIHNLVLELFQTYPNLKKQNG